MFKISTINLIKHACKYILHPKLYRIFIFFTMSAHEIGEKNYATFKVERLEKDPSAKKFHDTMKSNKLKTFSILCRKKEVKAQGRWLY